ncbi:unnamed protein product [Brassicogethes aeneus]|uniref:Tripeptidyl-peptidase 2 n=1 Tax=Brassicogethes aeneus TaxID=1431903 RepID=A0A9P0FNJ3_BRAAE|nr:unnamed protein product [Brassicogethes aeneus]
MFTRTVLHGRIKVFVRPKSFSCNFKMSEEPMEEFPVWGLLPKKETGVVSFLSKFPTYDGRGTVIAILDSGIDPGAPGLQKTSDGKVKVIHRFDCSGCADVNTSTSVTPVDGYITGLTGKKLKIPPSWKNPQGTYRIGVKHAFDLYPDRLKDRVKQEYKKKHWDDNQRKSIASITRQLNDFESKHNTLNINDMEKLEKEDIEAKLEILNNMEKRYSDSGPVYDCVLFKDGSTWYCCVDTTDDGDLSKCPLLGEYSITHDYAPLTEIDQLNFSMNVHDNGNILELVGVCSSHGTHVASIASAYFPDSPDLNGVAPGAQIVSLTIGDGRLGSMETGTALVRAMIKIMELRETQPVHVINMSYGEHAHWVDAGRIGELLNDVVNKYGVTWVASAGNNGPALGTISTPSDISQEPIISVGAYVSPDMMIAEYALRQKLPGSPYTWSSRGPTIDGGIGVHVCAPGGAITSVPNFTLRYSQLMNGTSMASPHVAGAVAVLISGMIQKKLPFTPYIIKKALENTAMHIKDVEHYAQGNGLVQIDKAFDYLLDYHSITESKVRFNIYCGSNNSKGINLRTKLTNTSYLFKVSVEPCFLDSDNVPAEEKINFNLKLTLTCNAEYVSFPGYLDISNVARLFAVKIDVTGLTEGVHGTFINAYDSASISKGPVFRIPITVIKPKEFTGESKYIASYNKVLFKPNTIKRHYYVVPSGATWAVLKLLADDDNGRFVIHTMQFVPRRSCKTLELCKTLAVFSNIETGVPFAVKGDEVLEVVIAKYWASLGDNYLDYSISFYGVKPNQNSYTMLGADGIYNLFVKTLQSEEILMSALLKNSVQIVRASDSKISPLTERDIIPPSRQVYELILTYNFTLVKQCEVSPNFAPLSDTLYESEFESQFWQLYDTNKQLLGCGDAYPSKYAIKLDKGDYHIKLQVRHDKKDLLEKLNEQPILIQQKLSSNLNLDIYNTHSHALTGGKKAGVTHVNNPNAQTQFYIAPLASDKFPAKSNNTAHFFTGVLTCAKDENGKRVDTYPFKYVYVDTTPSKKNNSSNSNGDKTKFDEYKEAIRDLKVQWLSKLDNANSESLYEELSKTYEDYLPVHTAYLQGLETLDRKILPGANQSKGNADLVKIIDVCNKVLESINEEALLAYIGLKVDTRGDAAKIKTTMEQQKSLYIECLSRKGIALCRLNGENKESDNLDSIKSIWRTLLKFSDTSDSKVNNHVICFAIWHAYVNQHYGRLLKYLLKLQDEKPSKEVEEKIIEFSNLLKWNHVKNYLQKSLPSKYPGSYKPF